MAGGKYLFKYGKNILKKYLAPVNQQDITIQQVANAKSMQSNLYYRVRCGKKPSKMCKTSYNPYYNPLSKAVIWPPLLRVP